MSHTLGSVKGSDFASQWMFDNTIRSCNFVSDSLAPIRQIVHCVMNVAIKMISLTSDAALTWGCCRIEVTGFMAL
uniref:AlNc14C132G6986 protein n=1 Tax=Albugo laibachii Nc14 TaxID=890382 RepID=F0WKD4_9STRA|nr:AlNc14C132G6986 [Albugo laibachii Nc14]|eukprot:CCA21738.1 AlNc14C132G6986 [Albugo laibachii Nc14]